MGSMLDGGGKGGVRGPGRRGPTAVCLAVEGGSGGALDFSRQLSEGNQQARERQEICQRLNSPNRPRLREISEVMLCQ